MTVRIILLSHDTFQKCSPSIRLLLYRLLSSFLDTPEHYHRRIGGRIKIKLLVNVRSICNHIANGGRV